MRILLLQLMSVAIAVATASAICGSSTSGQPIPDRAALASDPRFTKLGEGQTLGGSPYLAIGARQPFDDLKTELSAELERGGYSIHEPLAGAPTSDTSFTAVHPEGRDCIYYYNLSAPVSVLDVFRADVARVDQHFDDDLARYVTVLYVSDGECP